MSQQHHDCSENAYCFNLRGTYTCSCRDGFTDLSENPIYPGRVCSAEFIGCELCNYHGTCVDIIDDHFDNVNQKSQHVCECYHWYAGTNCQYNLKGINNPESTFKLKIKNKLNKFQCS